MKKIILLFAIFFSLIVCNAQCVSTLAGSGTSIDGVGTASRFFAPTDVAVDASGNIYVTDTNNSKIRKITSTGVVTTIAGSDVAGSADGTGTSAQFSGPAGIAVDGLGNIYVSDYNKIRKITSAGIVTTIAGSDIAGYADGAGALAQFNYPRGLSVDIAGNIYVADSNNHKIRKITAAGIVTTLAGSINGFANGTSAVAKFDSPKGIALDLLGNVYVADTNNHKIRKISTAGLVTTFAGSINGSTNGTGAAAQFSYPTGITVDSSGNLYVTDYATNRIRKITSTGVVTVLAGSSYGYVNGTGTSAKFSIPEGLAVNSSGIVYVADTNNNTIRKITASGVVTTFAGSSYKDGTNSNARFNFPNGVATDGLGNLYVTDTDNDRIRKITATGVVTTIAGSDIAGTADGTGTSAQFDSPTGVAVDMAGNIYVGDRIYNTIRKITPSGLVTTIAQGAGSAGIAVDILGNLYVADSNNHKINKINPAGSVTTIAGSTSGYLDGTGTSAQFNFPTGVAVDGAGNIYVADNLNYRIRKITPAGVVTTLAGSTDGYRDGIGSAAKFSSPRGIAIDQSNNLYVADYSNHRIRKINTSGVVTTLAGSSYGYADGSETLSQFYFPTGVSVDMTGNVYVADNANHRIRKISLPSTNISADGVIASSTTINIGSSVLLQLNGSLSAQPNIQWTPATRISSTTVSNPVVYPTGTTTYTARFINSNGCTQTTSITVNVNQNPLIGTLWVNTGQTIGLFDAITVTVEVEAAADIYSLYMKLKGNAAVSQYLDYSSYTAGTLFGTGGSVISTPPTITNGVPEFGITKVGSAPGFSGNGLFYTFTYITKNIPIPDGTSFCFYLDDVIAYNSLATLCGLVNEGQICSSFTNQLVVWPGDLNKSNTVTTADLLPIGYFYNSTGPARTNTNIQWSAHPATLWGYNHSSRNGDAYKVFADSNGDGVINNADQAAIGFNMNQVHARHSNAKPFGIAPKSQRNTFTLGNLIVTPNNTVIDGANLPQTVTFTVNLNNTGGLDQLYGISVNLIFDDTIFDLSTVTIDYAGSIFGIAGSDCLVMNYNSATGVSVGLTRYANAAINGQGLLFKVTIQTKITISALSQTLVSAYVDSANNQAGDSLAVQEAPETNFTVINNLGIKTIKADELVLYPNPANDLVYLVIGSNTNEANDLKIKVYNILGQKVEETAIQNATTELSTKNWGATGVYFIEIINTENTVLLTKKVLVIKK